MPVDDDLVSTRHADPLAASNAGVPEAFVTVHVGYREVPPLLTVERVLDTIELSAAAMQTARSITPLPTCSRR